MDIDTNYTRINADELSQWTQTSRNFVLLDVLPPEVYAARHLPGAVNACVFETSFANQLQDLGLSAQDSDKAIVVYGENNETKDTETAAKKLIRLGFKSVYALRGGLEAWAQQEYPLEGTTEMPADHSCTLEDGSYTVDVKQSLIEWTGRNANGSHSGTVALKSGAMRVVDGKLDGEFVIDLSTLSNTNLEDATLRQQLVAHLLSDDFLFVQRYPEALFRIEASESLPNATPGMANYHLLGELTLRGRAGTLPLSATITTTANGIAAEAHFDMDRTRWGLYYGSGKYFRNLGMHLVYDNVSMRLNIIAR